MGYPTHLPSPLERLSSVMTSSYRKRTRRRSLHHEHVVLASVALSHARTHLAELDKLLVDHVRVSELTNATSAGRIQVRIVRNHDCRSLADCDFEHADRVQFVHFCRRPHSFRIRRVRQSELQQAPNSVSRRLAHSHYRARYTPLQHCCLSRRTCPSSLSPHANTDDTGFAPSAGATTTLLRCRHATSTHIAIPASISRKRGTEHAPRAGT